MLSAIPWRPKSPLVKNHLEYGVMVTFWDGWVFEIEKKKKMGKIQHL